MIISTVALLILLLAPFDRSRVAETYIPVSVVQNQPYEAVMVDDTSYQETPVPDLLDSSPRYLIDESPVPIHTTLTTVLPWSPKSGVQFPFSREMFIPEMRLTVFFPPDQGVPDGVDFYIFTSTGERKFYTGRVSIQDAAVSITFRFTNSGADPSLDDLWFAVIPNYGEAVIQDSSLGKDLAPGGEPLTETAPVENPDNYDGLYRSSVVTVTLESVPASI